MASQRLAVGTDEGAIVMYDLKTATRLYVLESHKQGPAACSFSPDGHRLVSVSLEEGVVFVWKVGSSFASFFNPGAPPRQGHAGSEPFKSLNFNVGNAGEFFSPPSLASASSLRLIIIDLNHIVSISCDDSRGNA
jgi:WD40 repeat protein